MGLKFVDWMEMEEEGEERAKSDYFEALSSLLLLTGPNEKVPAALFSPFCCVSS